MTEQLQFYLFGGLSIQVGQRPLTNFQTQKETLLLAYLAMSQRPLPRETAATLLWPDADPKQALSNLRTALTRIRKTAVADSALADYLHADRHTIHLQTDGVWVDALAFAELIAAADDEIAQLETAVALYRGDFLAGIYASDSPDLENWQLLTAAQLQQQSAKARRKLAHHYLHTRQYDKGIAHARALLALDPLREEGCRLLMRLLARNGQQNAALQQYQQSVAILREELGVAPAEATTRLAERIRAARYPIPCELPAEPTPFVGHNAVLADVARRLDNGRLVTIVGTGGVGKTRLAVQVARQLDGEFLNGVYFVSLDDLPHPDQIPVAIAKAIGMSFSGADSPQTQLLRYLSAKELLLLLDNMEHLLGDGTAVRLIDDLLNAAPDLRLLVTSRERLRLRRETVIRLHGLPFPADADQTPEQLQTYEAVQLFAQRADAQGFRLQTEDDWRATAVICQLVEGLPLGIELASSTLDSHSLPTIAAEIGHNLGLLAADYADLPPRHRSVYAAFHYSWQLLTADEQTLLAQLAVFHGGFTLAAGQAINPAAQPTLARLAQKSLVHQRNGRYALHPLLRQFAARQLAQWPDLATRTEAEHGRFYLEWVVTHYPAFFTADWVRVRAELAADWENIQQAWGWGLHTESWTLLADVVTPLAFYYRETGLHQLGKTWLQTSIEQAPNAPPQLRAALSARLAKILYFLSEYKTLVALADEQIPLAQQRQDGWAEAIFRFERAMANRLSDNLATSLAEALAEARAALAIAEQGDDWRLRAYILRGVAFLEGRSGQRETAVTLFQQALAIYRQKGDRHGEFLTLDDLGSLHLRYLDPAQGRAFLEAGLAIAAERADPSAEQTIINTLGMYHSQVGDYSAAVMQFERFLQLAQQSGNPHQIARAQLNLGLDYWHLGRYGPAEAAYTAGLQLAQALAHRDIQANILVNWALLAFCQGDAKTAVAHAQQALTLVNHTGWLVSYAHNVLGYAYTALGRWQEAEDALLQALEVRQPPEPLPLWLETLAGLLHLAQRRDDAATARRYLAQILPHLNPQAVQGAEEPLRVYWWVAEALIWLEDDGATAVLQEASTILHTQSANITDETWRESFLHAIPYHHALLDLREGVPTLHQYEGFVR